MMSEKQTEVRSLKSSYSRKALWTYLLGRVGTKTGKRDQRVGCDQGQKERTLRHFLAVSFISLDTFYFYA